MYKVRLAGLGFMIHCVSTTEPYLDEKGNLVWTPIIKSVDSDEILKIDWNTVHLISYRIGEPRVEKQFDLNSLPTIQSKTDSNKKYVLLSDVKKLL